MPILTFIGFVLVFRGFWSCEESKRRYSSIHQMVLLVNDAVPCNFCFCEITCSVLYSNHLHSIKSLPLHEIYYFTDVNRLQKVDILNTHVYIIDLVCSKGACPQGSQSSGH